MELAEKRVFSSFFLKWIALMTMLIDHFAASILNFAHQLNPQFYAAFFTAEQMYFVYSFLRSLGRLSFPLYAFLLVEAYVRTRSKKKYFLRLLVLAFLSEILFDLAFFRTAFYWQYQNVFFTLATAVLMLVFYEKMLRSNLPFGKYIAFLSPLVFSYLSIILYMDYDFWGLWLIWGIFVLRERKILKWLYMLFLFVFTNPVHILSFPFVLLYDEKKGKRENIFWKIFFYGAYPVHLCIFYWIGESLKLFLN